MAQPLEPPESPTSADRVAEAKAAAEAAGREAERLDARESRRLADRLIAGAAEARFNALSDRDLRLTPTDRRRILGSLTGRMPPRRVIPGGTAGRWTLIRSRLRYRVIPLAVAGVMVLMAASSLILARASTPIAMVLSNASQDLQVPFRLKDGQIAFDTLEANTPYALVRQENGIAVLRRWKPGVGYAEAQVPVEAVYLKP